MPVTKGDRGLAFCVSLSTEMHRSKPQPPLKTPTLIPKIFLTVLASWDASGALCRSRGLPTQHNQLYNRRSSALS